MRAWAATTRATGSQFVALGTRLPTAKSPPKRPAKPARFFIPRAALCIKAALFCINRKPPVNLFLLDENIFLLQIPGKFSLQKRLYIQTGDCPLPANGGVPASLLCHLRDLSAMSSPLYPHFVIPAKAGISMFFLKAKSYELQLLCLYSHE